MLNSYGMARMCYKNIFTYGNTFREITRAMSAHEHVIDQSFIPNSDRLIAR